MTDPLPPPISEPIETQEKYLLHSSVQIESVLSDLMRKPELITAYFDNGKGYILTTLIGVLRERGLLVLEMGPDEDMNRRLLLAGRVSCIAKQHDITVRFNLAQVQQARYQGQPVLAAPLPESLFRMQRREYFRVTTPLICPLQCSLHLPDGQALELALSDISAGGLALIDPDLQFEAEIGQVFKHCNLHIPDEDSQVVDLMVRNLYIQGEDSKRPQIKIGCSYVKLTGETGSFIRRYVNRLQIQHKNLTRPV